ncbi:hypothetical protein MACH09_46800 [Vibrio sp. MACH09]|uniref:hypothetical protein n=1 Tax=Vibrio sp. MACH09 TaxID=3025122 RepID=UPI00278F53E8|nr:hypothetical protein [Vibrio sp. MACH09]GLO64172.1 hypothetical protein MACH09_46800 [Vibrio sp. MACH09]
MSRPSVVQVPLKDLEKRFFDYMKKEGIKSNAEAARNLMDLALRILENDNESITNRQLLEEIYRQVKKNGAVGNMIHAQTFDWEKMKRLEAESAAKREGILSKIMMKVDELLGK